MPYAQTALTLDNYRGRVGHSSAQAQQNIHIESSATYAQAPMAFKVTEASAGDLAQKQAYPIPHGAKSSLWVPDMK